MQNPQFLYKYLVIMTFFLVGMNLLMMIAPFYTPLEKIIIDYNIRVFLPMLLGVIVILIAISDYSTFKIPLYLFVGLMLLILFDYAFGIFTLVLLSILKSMIDEMIGNLGDNMEDHLN